MRKILKYIALMLVSIFVINALLSNVTYGDDTRNEILNYTNTDHSNIQTEADVNKYAERGTAEGASNSTRVTANGTTPISIIHDRDANLRSEQSSYIANSFANVSTTIFGLFQIIMSQCVGTVALSNNIFTIQNLLMGKYELFDINIFNKDVKSEAASDISKKIKESVESWYYSIRIFAIALSLLVLLYVAIRMAMSTTVSDKVRYKKMLLSWCVGFALIFLLHYLALFLISLSEQLVKLLISIIPTGEKPFEIAVLQRIMSAKTDGWNVLVRAVLYCMLVWYQIKFFYIYLKRVISNAFLILISPLVTVTYAIDKASDCKAQAFSSWLEELITNILIQPVHLLLFLVLLYSAGAIAELYPIVAILFLFGLGQAEKIFKGLFKLKGTTIGGVEEGQSFTGLVNKI